MARSTAHSASSLNRAVAAPFAVPGFANAVSSASTVSHGNTRYSVAMELMLASRTTCLWSPSFLTSVGAMRATAGRAAAPTLPSSASQI